MSTGLFPVRDDRRGGPRRGFVPKNRLAANGHTFAANKRMLADLLAEGVPTVAEASRQLGISHMTGNRLFAHIRKDLGWQAQ